MAQVTVQNDSGKPLSLHPWGKRLDAGASLLIDTEIDHPQLFNLVRDLIDRSILSVTGGTMPGQAAIDEALSEFDVRSPRAIEERELLNGLVPTATTAGAADGTYSSNEQDLLNELRTENDAAAGQTPLGGYHNP